MPNHIARRWRCAEIASAKDLLVQVMDALGDNPLPVVGSEPACVASFRDELPNLFPNDPRAKALSERTWMLSEFLQQRDWQPPRLERRTVVHAHCNHHAIMGVSAEKKLLSALGLDFEWTRVAVVWPEVLALKLKNTSSL